MFLTTLFKKNPNGFLAASYASIYSKICSLALLSCSSLAASSACAINYLS